MYLSTSTSTVLDPNPAKHRLKQTSKTFISRQSVCNVIRRWYISMEIQYLTNNILKECASLSHIISTHISACHTGYG